MVRRETKTLQGSTDDDQYHDGKTWYDDDDENDHDDDVEGDYDDDDDDDDEDDYDDDQPVDPVHSKEFVHQWLELGKSHLCRS